MGFENYTSSEELLPEEAKLAEEVAGWDKDLVDGFYDFFDALGYEEGREDGDQTDYLDGFEKQKDAYDKLISEGYSHEDIYKAYRRRAEELKEEK